MFKKYGVIGLILIVLVELNFIFKIEPFAKYYFIIVWVGYILVVDALVYRFRGSSYIMNKKWQFLGLFLLSVLFWWIFEFMNLRVGNWNYNTVYGVAALGGVIRKSIYFSTVLPALFETFDLVIGVHLFDKVKLRKKHKISKEFLYVMIFIGVLCFVLPLVWPKYFFPLIWMCFFFILDPINYLHGEKSIVGHLKDRKLKVPLSLWLAGLVMGFFWEFWNYWAVTKWHYDLPYLGLYKIFEMPVLGYLGYLPFAWSLYSMYYFVRSLVE